MAEVNASSSGHRADTNAVLDAVVADLTAIRAEVVKAVADITALDTAFDTLVAKLNADGGVTDTDYAGAAAMTATDPAAMTTTTD